MYLKMLLNQLSLVLAFAKMEMEHLKQLLLAERTPSKLLRVKFQLIVKILLKYSHRKIV